LTETKLDHTDDSCADPFPFDLSSLEKFVPIVLPAIYWLVA